MKALDAKISRVIILCLVFISPSNAFYKNSNFDMNNSTCPKTFIPLPNSYSLIDYINSRQTCTQACNNAGYCCTKGAGGCNNVPCTEGCHIAWFSEDLEACKAQCRIANDAPDCVYTWNHEKIGEAGFNPFYQFGTGVVKCFGSDSCGCPVGFGFGSSNDCGSHACEAGCEFAHSLELRNLFFHGETVNVDEHVNGDMQALLATINTLSAYVQNSLEFNKTQIQQTMMDFDKGSAFLETEFHLMEAALDLVDDYEVRHGPLFLSSKTINGIPKTDTQDDGLDLERAMLQIQQTILDEIYHATLPTLAYQTRLYSSVISECASFLWGRKWQTSRFFPGYVDPPSNSSTVYNVTIKATNPKSWGRPVCFDEDPKIRTTGLYLPPGEIAFVSVPEFIIGKKYTIRVGAANADHQNKNVNKRMNRVTCNYDINNSTVAIASPLGGGIYIMVPFMADEGIVQISITGGVVQAPIYSNTSVYTTSEQEWESLRITPSPWADFETDLFLLNVPRSWMYNYNYAHIQQLVEDYHSSMEGILELKGYPVDKRNDHVLYIQADITIRHGTFGVGYPQINNLVHSGPDGPVTAGHHSLPGLSTHWLIAEGPFSENSDVCFHELGHCQITSMYRGEHEAIVNLYHAYIRNVKDNLDLDIAFSESLERDGNWSIDNAAISWMVTENFRQGNNMDHTNTQRDEFRYQHRGYAKYVDIARLFGWQVLINFFYQENLHYRSYGNNNSIEGLSVTDDRTLRLSMAAGYDLSLLIHFWGIEPENEIALKNKIKEKTLPQSEAVYDLVNRYATLIPMSSEEFLLHFEDVHPGKLNVPSCSNPLFGCGWYNAWSGIYSNSHGESAVNTIQELLSKYPTQSFTRYPTIYPTNFPSLAPSHFPSLRPSSIPTRYPTVLPSLLPSTTPSNLPSHMPSLPPSSIPTRYSTQSKSSLSTFLPSRFSSHTPFFNLSSMTLPL